MHYGFVHNSSARAGSVQQGWLVGVQSFGGSCPTSCVGGNTMSKNSKWQAAVNITTGVPWGCKMCLGAAGPPFVSPQVVHCLLRLEKKGRPLSICVLGVANSLLGSALVRCLQAADDDSKRVEKGLARQPPPLSNEWPCVHAELLHRSQGKPASHCTAGHEGCSGASWPAGPLLPIF